MFLWVDGWMDVLLGALVAEWIANGGSTDGSFECLDCKSHVCFVWGVGMAVVPHLLWKLPWPAIVQHSR